MSEAVSVRITLEPGTDMWDKNDDRWRGDLIDLRRTLERDAPEAVEAVPAGSDGKGLVLAPIILALGSAGVFTAIVESLKAWLGRRPSTSTVSGQIEVDGKVTTFTFQGTHIDNSALVSVAKAALGKE